MRVRSGVFVPPNLYRVYILICIFSSLSRACGYCGQPQRAPMRGALCNFPPKSRDELQKFIEHPNVERCWIKRDKFSGLSLPSIFWMPSQTPPIFGGRVHPDLWGGTRFDGRLSTPRGIYPQFFASYPQKREKGVFPPVFHSPKYGVVRIEKAKRGRQVALMST